MDFPHVHTISSAPKSSVITTRPQSGVVHHVSRESFLTKSPSMYVLYRLKSWGVASLSSISSFSAFVHLYPRHVISAPLPSVICSNVISLNYQTYFCGHFEKI